MGLGFNDFTAGDILTAAQVDGYLMRQTQMVFASTAARDSALSGNLEEGMRAYTTDQNTEWVYNGSSWEIVSEPLQTWTPTWTQNAGSIGVTVTRGWYSRSRGQFHAHTTCTVTSNPGSGGDIEVTLPVTMANLNDASGFLVWDSTAGTDRLKGLVFPVSTTKIAFADVLSINQDLFSATQVGNGDVFRVDVWGTY